MIIKLTKNEESLFRKLNTPAKLQDFLNKLALNKERGGETVLSPRNVLKRKRAHCLEGALFAAAVLWHHGGKPLILDLRAEQADLDHVVALFKQNGCWGAISKTNHAVLRYREPIYKTVHELVMSYFHEYFLNSGRKTLRSYSAPFDLSRFGADWVTSKEDLWFIDEALNKARHFPILNKKQIASLRKADKIEIKAGNLKEY